MYTALVLDDNSQKILRNLFESRIPNDWDMKCHHMTINMGVAIDGPAIGLLGKEFDIKLIAFSKDERCCAVFVETDAPSKNKLKHITVAVNVNGGGKPKHSNELTDWIDFPSDSLALTLKGVVKEVQ